MRLKIKFKKTCIVFISILKNISAITYLANVRINCFYRENFDFLIDDSIKITGKIDLINIVDKNLIEIIDFKSSSRRLSEEELKMITVENL